MMEHLVPTAGSLDLLLKLATPELVYSSVHATDSMHLNWTRISLKSAHN